MKIRLLPSLLLMVVVSTYVRGSDTLIKNVVVYDGTGTEAFKADVRVRVDRITAIVKNLSAQLGAIVRDEHGLALAPGFIAMHSPHDHGIVADLNPEAVARQG